MILKSEKSVNQLIKDVCSPKGATLKGLEVFEEKELNKIIDKAADECIKRAYELANIKSE